MRGGVRHVRSALFLTPSLTGDGIFIANNSLALGSAPFGPHTTAHGRWVPTSATGFVADYTFMLPSWGPPPLFLPPPPHRHRKRSACSGSDGWGTWWAGTPSSAS